VSEANDSSDVLCRINLHQLHLRTRFRYGLAVLSQSFNMEVYSLPNEPKHFFA